MIARYKIMLLFPGRDPKQVCRELLEGATFRAVAEFLGVTPRSLLRYSDKCGVCKSATARGHPHRYSTLLDILGRDPVRTLMQLKEEYKTWRAVAYMIGVEEEMLREFRRRLYKAKLIPKKTPLMGVTHRGDWVRKFLSSGISPVRHLVV